MVLMIAAASRELKDFEDFFFVLDRVVLEAQVKSALRVGNEAREEAAVRE